MKTIPRIIIILLVASVVTGAFSLTVNNSSITSSANEGGGPSAITSADGQTVSPIERPEGGDLDGGSITQGLAEVLVTFAKLTAIAVIVLLIQKVFSLLGKRRLISTQQ